jgi:hypothetical protein
MFGREGHVVSLQDVMRTAGEACGRDEIERILLRKIAQAHGGTLRGVRDSNDKIGLTLEPVVSFTEDDARPRVISSILRFADELSDDKKRAYKTLLEINKIPKKSQVFHAYATSLEAVTIKHDEKSVELRFFIHKDFTLEKFGKLEEEIYLLDEVYNRTMKINLGRIYCMQFCKKLIDIEKIVVEIRFYANFVDDELFPPINFTLCDSGYPETHRDGIYGLCDTLVDGDGNNIDGEYVRNKIYETTDEATDETAGETESEPKSFFQKIKRVFK